jgi:hypothetical protein
VNGVDDRCAGISCSEAFHTSYQSLSIHRNALIAYERYGSGGVSDEGDSGRNLKRSERLWQIIQAKLCCRAKNEWERPDKRETE